MVCITALLIDTRSRSSVIMTKLAVHIPIFKKTSEDLDIHKTYAILTRAWLQAVVAKGQVQINRYILHCSTIPKGSIV
jgi:hypothetical protein